MVCAKFFDLKSKQESFRSGRGDVPGNKGSRNCRWVCFELTLDNTDEFAIQCKSFLPRCIKMRTTMVRCLHMTCCDAPYQDGTKSAFDGTRAAHGDEQRPGKILRPSCPASNCLWINNTNSLQISEIGCRVRSTLEVGCRIMAD